MALLLPIDKVISEIDKLLRAFPKEVIQEFYAILQANTKVGPRRSAVGSPTNRKGIYPKTTDKDTLVNRTFRLLKSFLLGNPETLTKITNDGFVIGSKVPYARIQDRGGVAGNGARITGTNYFTNSVKDLEELLPTLEQELVDGIEKVLKRYLE